MSATKYTQSIVEIAEKHLPLLEHDVNNASTLYTLQDAVRRLQQLVAYLVHNEIERVRIALAAALPPGAATAAVPVSAPVPQVRQPPAVAAPAIPRPASVNLPLPPLGGTSSAPLPPLSGGPATSESKVMEVNVTPQGTNVKLPGGPVVQLPAGAAVPLFEESKPIVEGPNDVILPPGGGIAPDAAAAIAAATGGARNITNDPPPQG